MEDKLIPILPILYKQIEAAEKHLYKSLLNAKYPHSIATLAVSKFREDTLKVVDEIDINALVNKMANLLVNELLQEFQNFFNKASTKATEQLKELKNELDNSKNTDNNRIIQ